MDEAALKRLRWRCRRGTQELDLLLRRYLDEAFPHLGPQQQAAFERLLGWEDDQLQACLLAERGEGGAPLMDEETTAIVAAIRRHAGLTTAQ